jgi:hypothetical protein
VTACHGPAASLPKSIPLALTFSRARCPTQPHPERELCDLVVRDTMSERTFDQSVGVVTCSAGLCRRSSFALEGDPQVGDVSTVGHDVRYRAAQETKAAT